MSQHVKIYDTTLRDGTQGEGISFSVTDKLLLARKLDQFGVDYIEGGFPGSNPRDIAFFAEAKNLKLKHAKLAAFGSTRRAGVKPENLDETTLSQFMAMNYAPDPDLFIRTGGEVRISNFLLWQVAYAELYFTEALWPDVDADVLAGALAEFARRERRYGLTSAQIKAAS